MTAQKSDTWLIKTQHHLFRLHCTSNLVTSCLINTRSPLHSPWAAAHSPWLLRIQTDSSFIRKILTCSQEIIVWRSAGSFSTKVTSATPGEVSERKRGACLQLAWLMPTLWDRQFCKLIWVTAREKALMIASIVLVLEQSLSFVCKSTLHVLAWECLVLHKMLSFGVF